MIEIVFLIFFGNKLAGIARARGRTGLWALLGVAFWIAGELMGFIIGGILGLGMGGYLIALPLAGVGAGVAYAIVNNLPQSGEPRF